MLELNENIFEIIEPLTYSGIGGSEYVGKGGTGGDGDTAGTGSIEPGGSVKLSLFFDIW